MVKIDIVEKFETFQRAPIVEAVIDIRSQATIELTEEMVRERVDAKIPEFVFLDSIREFHHEFKIEDGSPPSQIVKHLGWKGVRYRSKDERYIAQFNRDGFVLGRLEPYENWENLFSETMRLWGIYRELTQPVELSRVGLRYINRIRLPIGDFDFEKYLTAPPASPIGLALPYTEFMHRETLAVMGHPYAINLIKTLQPPPDTSEAFGLILDIDVFTTELENPAMESVPHRLAEMRWLKNKAFFGSVNDKSLKLFR